MRRVESSYRPNDRKSIKFHHYIPRYVYQAISSAYSYIQPIDHITRVPSCYYKCMYVCMYIYIYIYIYIRPFRLLNKVNDL